MLRTALDDYKVARGAYPEHLNLLVPDFIDRVPFRDDKVSLEYNLQPDGRYRLGFSYAAGFTLGQTKCSTGSESQQWTCHSRI